MAKILIVEDEPDALAAFTKLFQQAGHEVAGACNGREALMQVLQSLPDVVLLDLAMPEMDGPSFLEVVRSYLRLQSLPVVIITGLFDTPLVDRVQHSKVNAVLAKGKVSNDDILKTVEQAIGHVPG
jgi:CheY-like chemotaxis protein